MTEKGTPSYLTKELLVSAVLQVNAKAQWEVAGHSGQRDLHKTLVLRGIPPHTALGFTISCI